LGTLFINMILQHPLMSFNTPLTSLVHPAYKRQDEVLCCFYLKRQ